MAAGPVRRGSGERYPGIQPHRGSSGQGAHRPGQRGDGHVKMGGKQVHTVGYAPLLRLYPVLTLCRKMMKLATAAPWRGSHRKEFFYGDEDPVLAFYPPSPLLVV